MKVGINGMGRMGRLALRAAMGGIVRADGDPRGANRLDVVHVNAAAPADGRAGDHDPVVVRLDTAPRSP